MYVCMSDTGIHDAMSLLGLDAKRIMSVGGSYYHCFLWWAKPRCISQSDEHIVVAAHLASSINLGRHIRHGLVWWWIGHIDLHVFASRAHYQVPTGNLQTPSVCNVLEVAIGAMHPNRFSNIKHQRPRVIPVPEHMKAQLSGLMRLVGDFGCWQL